MHKSRIFLYFLLAFIVGVSVGSFLKLSPMLIIVVVSIGGLGLILFWRREWRLVVIALSIILFAFGASRAMSYRLDRSVLAEFTDRKNDITFWGYVNQEPQISATSQKLVIRVKRVIIPRHVIQTDESILVTLPPYPRYDYGKQLSLIGKLESPKSSSEFDYKNYLAKDGIFTTLFYPEIKEVNFKINLFESTKLRIIAGTLKTKNIFENSLARALPEPNASFISGILLGSKTNIPEHIKDDFSRTSTTHVLAISGYNITIIAEIISAIMLIFLRRSVAFWFVLIGIILFTILTGAQASVVRASVMGILVLLARSEGRMYDIKNSLALAAAVMLFFNPMILRYDVGFQLSFAATFGLVFLSPKLELYFARFDKLTASKILKSFKIRDSLLMTLSAQIFVLPLILYYFKSFSLIALPANLILLPTIPYALLLGFIYGLTGIFKPFLGQVIGYLAWLVTTIDLRFVELMAKPSWASINFNFGLIFVTLSYTAILVFLMRHKIFKSRNENK